MKQRPIILIGILAGLIILLSAFESPDLNVAYPRSSPLMSEVLQRQALEILETKCNVCHRKQNPLMIFKDKNMSKRAAKIYKMVFIEHRMPKGNEVRLTNQEEYTKLEQWLFTQNIY